ncbi:unnamed protein product, partial [Laminaria digitata]
VGGALIGLTAEALGRLAVALDGSGRVKLVEQYMLAFDDVWPSDLPNLRPLQLTIPRPLVAARDGGEPVYLMPMHRRRRGGGAWIRKEEEEEALLVPPPLRRDGDETARKRDRFCFEDESRYGKSYVKGDGCGGADEGGAGRRWPRCKLWATGVGTWRWEWSPEAQVMLGRLALWKGAMLVSRTHAI